MILLFSFFQMVFPSFSNERSKDLTHFFKRVWFILSNHHFLSNMWNILKYKRSFISKISSLLIGRRAYFYVRYTGCSFKWYFSKTRNPCIYTCFPHLSYAKCCKVTSLSLLSFISNLIVFTRKYLNISL